MATKSRKSLGQSIVNDDEFIDTKAKEDIAAMPIEKPVRKTPIVQVMSKQTKDTTTTNCLRIDNKLQKALLRLNNETGQFGALVNYCVARGIVAILHDMQKGNNSELFTSFNPNDDSVAGVRDKLLNELIAD
jgi:hypothetical protein